MAHGQLLPLLPVPNVHLVGVASDSCYCTLYMHILYLMVVCLVDQGHIANGLEHVLLDINPCRNI